MKPNSFSLQYFLFSYVEIDVGI